MMVSRAMTAIAGIKTTAAIGLICTGLGMAHAQSSGGILGGLGGGLTPSVGRASTSNVTGVLGYCVKNKLVNSTGAAGVLSQLSGKPSVTSSPDYKAGLAGTLLSGGKSASPSSGAAGMLGGLTGTSGSKGLSLDSLPSGVRNKLCDAVLTHAKSAL